MSDETTSQQLDELASAYLDGEATAEEAARVEADPGLLARVEELRAVRELLVDDGRKLADDGSAEFVPIDAVPAEFGPDDAVRDQMIARALAQRAPVVSMEEVKRRRQPRARTVLAAAAVVAALAVLGVTLLDRNSGDPAEQFADQAAPSANQAGSLADEAESFIDESVPTSARAEEGNELAEAELDLAKEATLDDGAALAADPAPAPEVTAPEDTAPEVTAPEVTAPEDAGIGGESVQSSGIPEPAAAQGSALPEFATEADLSDFVAELPATQNAVTDLRGCPQDPGPSLNLADETPVLVARFAAIVEGMETLLSVYQSAGEPFYTLTTPAPACQPLLSHPIAR